MVENKICSKCGKNKVFYKSFCKTCYKIYRNIKDRKNQKKIKNTLVKEYGNKCSICGYSKCIGALHFHHKDPTQKSFAISDCKSITKARKEVHKCILVCSNCHAELHNKLNEENNVI